VTVYAFAIENFNRPKEEVNSLMKLAEEGLVRIAESGYVCVLWLLTGFCSSLHGAEEYSINMGSASMCWENATSSLLTYRRP
jgi:undecaprenyl pyrophosphate synthase